MSKQQSGIVIIGKKPIMNYVVACLTLFDSGINKVRVKARGIAISRAVDTVELLRRAFVKGLETNDINMGTQEFIKKNGANSRISTIEIVISKPTSKLKT